MLCVLRCSHIIKYYFIIITMYDFYWVSARIKKKIGLLYAPSCSYHMLPAWLWEPERRLFLPQNYLLLTERWRHSNPLQYSSLENPMDGGAWWATFHGVAKSRTRLSDFTFTFHFSLSCMEKEMATHSSVLAWRIPGTAEPGGLPAMGSHRVWHDWLDLAAAAAVLKEVFMEVTPKNSQFKKL